MFMSVISPNAHHHRTVVSILASQSPNYICVCTLTLTFIEDSPGLLSNSRNPLSAFRLHHYISLNHDKYSYWFMHLGVEFIIFARLFTRMCIRRIHKRLVYKVSAYYVTVRI